MKKGKMKVLVFMGPPGSGKGTQTDMLAERLKIPAISAGELLRLEIKKKTKIGKMIEKKMDSGRLVPDEIIMDVMEKRLKKPDLKKGFILDGFPRHKQQLEDLEKILDEVHEAERDVLVFYVQISSAEVRSRIGNRRVCFNCGSTYHLAINQPKKKGVCDVCGHPVERRKDDEPEAISRRLRNFHKESDPLLDYFSTRNKVFLINGKQDINKVQKDILKDLEMGRIR